MALTTIGRSYGGTTLGEIGRRMAAEAEEDSTQYSPIFAEEWEDVKKRKPASIDKGGRNSQWWPDEPGGVFDRVDADWWFKN